MGLLVFVTSVWWFRESWWPWAIALYLLVMHRKWNEVSREYERKVVPESFPRPEVDYQFPVDLFRDAQMALRNEDYAYAESLILELDRRYSRIKDKIRSKRI